MNGNADGNEEIHEAVTGAHVGEQNACAAQVSNRHRTHPHLPHRNHYADTRCTRRARGFHDTAQDGRRVSVAACCSLSRPCAPVSSLSDNKLLDHTPMG